jgi:hypothetical protein
MPDSDREIVMRTSSHSSELRERGTALRDSGSTIVTAHLRVGAGGCARGEQHCVTVVEP